MSKQTFVRLRCGICGNDTAKFACFACQIPMCDEDARIVSSVLRKKLPFPVHYCKECYYKKWLFRIWQHFPFNPFANLWQIVKERLKKAWYWIKRL